jgi:hypothetical protein
MKRILVAFLCLFATSAFATGLLTPNIQGQDQNQGQAQGQLQGQGQAQMTNVSNRISNEIRNNALSFAAGGTAGATSRSTSSSASGGNVLTVNEAPIPAVTRTEYGGEYIVKGVPNVFSGNVYPTAPCMGSSTVGGAGVGFGFSVGSSWTDDECGIRETARSFAGMGMKEDSLAILCTSKYAAAAPSCPKPVAKE